MILVGNVAERPHRIFFEHAAPLSCHNAVSMRPQLSNQCVFRHIDAGNSAAQYSRP
jgi:hypothetical protein